MKDAESESGQFLFHLMKEFGITPKEWREMDSRDTLWLISAYSDKNRRENRIHKQRQQAQKAQANLGRARRRR